MRSPSCITRSELLILGLTGLAAAASQGQDLTVQYGSQAARATLQVDLQATDVYVDMSGHPQHDSDSGEISAAGKPGRREGRTDTVIRREETRSIMENIGRNAGESPDSVTARVVGAIRRSQEAFYQGDYDAAQRYAESSLALHPTADGYALSGSIAWVRKDFTYARRQWQSALRLDPDYPGVAAMLGRLPAGN